MRAVGLVLAALGLVLAGCGNVQLQQSAKGKGLAREYTITITDKGFDPARLRVQAGIPATVTVKNQSKAKHNFVIDQAEEAPAVRFELAPGQSETFELTGTYTWAVPYYSDLPGDKEAGYVGEMAMRTEYHTP